MTDAPERIYIDRGPRGGWMHRHERMPDTQHEYIRADLARPRVKPLVWGKDTMPSVAPQRYKATTHGGFGDYSVTGYHQKDEWQWFRNGYFVDGHQHHAAMPLEAAKAAAQADYEARILAALDRAPLTPAARDALAPFQSRVAPWLEACFGAEIAADKAERNHRFLEEALELVQSGGCTKSEAYQLVDYVYGRPVGEMAQEVGGVMNTLAALCLAHGLDMHEAGEVELVRVWGKIDKIRAKQAAKPKNSPLAERNAATDLMSIPEVAALVEAARWIAENDDAGDMFYHAQGKFAKRASAALAPFTAAQGDAK